MSHDDIEASKAPLIEHLIELQAPEASEHVSPHVPLAWARQWPAEEIWCARKRSSI